MNKPGVIAGSVQRNHRKENLVIGRLGGVELSIAAVWGKLPCNFLTLPEDFYSRVSEISIDPIPLSS